MLTEKLKSSQLAFQSQNFNLKEFRESVRKEFTQQNSYKNDPLKDSKYPHSNQLQFSQTLINQDPLKNNPHLSFKAQKFENPQNEDSFSKKNDSFVKNNSILIPNFLSIGNRGKSLGPSFPHTAFLDSKMRDSQIANSVFGDSQQNFRKGTENHAENLQHSLDYNKTSKWHAPFSLTNFPALDKPTFSVQTPKNNLTFSTQHRPEKRSNSLFEKIPLKSSNLFLPSSNVQTNLNNDDPKNHSSSIFLKIQNSREKLFQENNKVKMADFDTVNVKNKSSSQRFQNKSGLEKKFPVEMFRNMIQKFNEESVEDFKHLPDELFN